MDLFVDDDKLYVSDKFGILINRGAIEQTISDKLTFGELGDGVFIHKKYHEDSGFDGYNEIICYGVLFYKKSALVKLLDMSGEFGAFES